jgi:DNA-binding CsgD family transcriptional regulator
MEKKDQPKGGTGDTDRVNRAEARTEEAETRTEQARTRAEVAETRTEQAETRTEFAKTRTEHAEIRAEQAETTLDLCRKEHATRPVEGLALNATTDQKSQLERLTGRQREILRLIAEGQNTKQIAGSLNVSPKTVEYHRMKLMATLDVHDIPGLVRFALYVGLIPPES